MDYRFSLVGLCIGFLVGLTGIGGGALLTPIMILVFKVPPIFAVGVDFVYSAITKALGTIIHVRQKHVNMHIALTLSMGSIPAIILSSILIHIFHSKDVATANGVIKHTLGIILIFVALILVLKSFILGVLKNTEHIFFHHKKLVVICAGALIGFIVGFTSVGSGSLIIVILAFLYPKLSNRELVGTDIFQALLLLIAGSLVFISFGSVNWGLVFSLLIGSLPGVFIGSKLTRVIPDRFLRPVLALLLIITGYELFR